MNGSTLPCALAIVLLCACGDDGSSNQGTGASGSGGDLQFGTSASGSGGNEFPTGGTSGTGAGTGGGAPSCDGGLKVVVRDFTTTNRDFEGGTYVDDRGIVQVDLGPDGKPVYAGNPTTPTTHGKESFDQWFRDVPGVNVNIPITLTLTKGANNLYTYDNQAFFPIDDQGSGNEGNPHNFHFTDEVHTSFVYKGGEVFTFSGDDDLFGFINNKLVIDLGGIHVAEDAVVNLDEVAPQIGLTIGQTYPLDLFGAERHVTESHYRIETTIDCFVDPVPR